MKMLNRPKSMLRDFIKSEASGGIILMIVAFVAMIMANSSFASSYFGILDWTIGPTFTPKLGPTTLHLWINDGLMAIFFYVVGLEVKREFLDGHLTTWADRRLPLVAALGGMAFPAVVYLSIVAGNADLTRGWAIPAATDIAFALGVAAMLGKRVPTSLKLFLTTVAIIDDMGAVAIIALFYTSTLTLWALAAAIAVFALLLLLNRWGARHPAWYLIGFALMWYFMLVSGVHATIAGVLAAFAVPLRATPAAPEAADSTLHRLEHGLHPWVAFAIVPIFGFANAGVSLDGLGLDTVLAPLPLGIALGLFIGKQLGVFGLVALAVRLRIAQRPAGASWRQIYGVSLLCGIGFTMSLFIGALAFPNQPEADAAKIGVLIGSLASALLAVLVLRFSGSLLPKPVKS